MENIIANRVRQVPLTKTQQKIADYFIKVALERKYAPQILPKLDDKLTQKAHEYAAKLER